MTELPRVTSPEDQPDNESYQVENESAAENHPTVDTSQLCQELRRDLETMRNEHRLIVNDINSIQREFKELVRKAQEQNALCRDFARESVFEYTTDYSTETDDSVSCTGDIDETIHRKPDPNKMKSLKKIAVSSHAGESITDDLVNFSKIVDGQRKSMFFKKENHFLSTERRGSSMIIDLERNRRLNGRQLDQGRYSQKKMLTSMQRRNSAMPHVQYFTSTKETSMDDNVFDNQRVSSYGVHQQSLTQDRQLNTSEYNVRERNLVATSLKDSRTASNGPSSLRRLESKRGSLSVEVGHGSHGYRSHNGHRRASEMLPNHLGSLFSQHTGKRWEHELRNSKDKRRSFALLEEDENSFQGKRETNL